MTLEMIIISTAFAMGWSMPSSEILVKKLVGNNEVVINLLNAQWVIMSLPTDGKTIDDMIGDFLLEIEGSAVLKLMGEEAES